MFDSKPLCPNCGSASLHHRCSEITNIRCGAVQIDNTLLVRFECEQCERSAVPRSNMSFYLTLGIYEYNGQAFLEWLDPVDAPVKCVDTIQVEYTQHSELRYNLVVDRRNELQMWFDETILSSDYETSVIAERELRICEEQLAAQL